MKVDYQGVCLFPQFLSETIVVWDVEVEGYVALFGCDCGRDNATKGRRWRPWGCEAMHHHTNSHQDTPELGLNVQYPSRARFVRASHGISRMVLRCGLESKTRRGRTKMLYGEKATAPEVFNSRPKKLHIE